MTPFKFNLVDLKSPLNVLQSPCNETPLSPIFLQVLANPPLIVKFPSLFPILLFKSKEVLRGLALRSLQVALKVVPSSPISPQL